MASNQSDPSASNSVSRSSSNGDTINYIRILITKRNREIADLEEMHEAGDLTPEELYNLRKRSMNKFQNEKQQ
jgi:hypothetical protein